jgi:outer membrane protein assembly factor BamB
LTRVLVACLLGLASAQALAEEWPEFRGPTGQGHSSDTNLPIEWSESKNVRWKTSVPGLGWSSPVIAGGRVWLTTATEAPNHATESRNHGGARAANHGGAGAGSAKKYTSLRALAYDVETGKEVVNVEVFRLTNARQINPKNSFASPTPVLDEDRVYVHFGADGTAQLNNAGQVIWKTRLPYESQHGAGGSPIIYGDLLIVSCDGHDAAFVVALDKRTGKVRWKSNRRQPADQAYTTPLVIRVGERDQVVSVGAYRATAFEPHTGKEIWRVAYGDGFSNVPRPVYGHGLVYLTTGFHQPAIMAIRADGTGDVTKTHVAWTLKRGAPYTPSPLLVGDELYMITDAGIVSCLDAKTGAVHWQMRLDGTYSASPVFADGRIYFLGEHGGATVITPGKTFRRVATNMLEGAMLASMAVSGGSLFIRTDRYLYRITEAGRLSQ